MTRKEELNEAWCKYRGKCSTEILHALAFALMWCTEHPHWISVEDELPNTNEDSATNLGDFLFYTEPIDEDDAYDGRYRTGFYNAGTNTYELRPNRFGNAKVTHWMALPSPPEHFADVSKKISGSSEIPNNHTKTIEKRGE